MKKSDINIRDPFVMRYKGIYYLYGTRSATCWGPADGFDCYASADLEEWEGPFEIFKKPEGFFADRSYWAPECYFDRNAFYLVTTLEGEGRNKGIYVLKSDHPKGPFAFYAGPLTPADWSCIDGTLYWEEGTPWLIFSHSFEDSPTGDICLVPLEKDLSAAAGPVEVLFSAAQAPWARPVPFAEAEFGKKGEVYFTDGPCLTRMDSGNLHLTWSSWSVCGYAVGDAVSTSGKVQGPWKQLPQPVYPENGGHGMLFRDPEGQWNLALHAPNDKYQERPCFFPLEEVQGRLQLKEGKEEQR